jgi:hypothetical protein
MFAWSVISTSVTEAVLVFDSIVEFVGLVWRFAFCLVVYEKLASAGERKAKKHEEGG